MTWCSAGSEKTAEFEPASSGEILAEFCEVLREKT